MSYAGDYALGSTIDFKFTTRQATGAPFALAGSPAVAAFVGNSTTEITAGITLTVDFDARTGLNNVRVVASSGNGFATGTDVALVLTAGTVNGVSVAGEVIGSFSIEKASALRPTVAARTLDVSAGGEAGVDWANVGSPTTSLALTGTTISTAQVAGSLGATAKADVNAEVLDVLTVDTFAEPAAVPAATSTLKDKLNWVFMMMRNKRTQTATTQLIRNDGDSATIGTVTVSDDGTTFIRGKAT